MILTLLMNLKLLVKKIDNENSKKKDKYIGDLVKNSSFEYDGDLLKLLLKIRKKIVEEEN